MKLLREKSTRANKMRLDSPVNSESAANWRARLRAARGFKTEENTETESSNARKVLLRINTAKYLSRDAIPGGTSLDEVNTKDDQADERTDNPRKTKSKARDRWHNGNETIYLRKVKEQLRNSPPPTQTPSGRLLLRSSSKEEQGFAASFHFKSIKRNSEIAGKNSRNRSLTKSSSMNAS